MPCFACIDELPSVIIKSPDTDVFFIALNASSVIPSNVYFETGNQKNLRIISLDKVRLHYGPQCHIRRNTTLPDFNTGNFTVHGWGIDDDGVVYVKWMNLPPAPASILESVNCKCTKGCGNNRCSCRKSSLKCTELCKCHDCQNSDAYEEPGDSDSYDCSQSSESDED